MRAPSGGEQPSPQEGKRERDAPESGRDRAGLRYLDEQRRGGDRRRTGEESEQGEGALRVKSFAQCRNQPPMNADTRRSGNETPRRKAAKARRRCLLNMGRKICGFLLALRQVFCRWSRPRLSAVAFNDLRISACASR